MSTHFDTDSFMRLNTLTETHAVKAAERAREAVYPPDGDVHAAWSGGKLVKAGTCPRIKYRQVRNGKTAERTS